MKKTTEAYLVELLDRYPALKSAESEIYGAALSLIHLYQHKGKLLVCGNGGSAADSLHIVGELMKSFQQCRPIPLALRNKLEKYEDGDDLGSHLQMPLRAIALVCESGLNTAFANDVNPEYIFAQQVLGYGDKGDILMAISTSGNFRNVVYAAEIAKALGLTVIALTGQDGGKLKKLADICITVPEAETFKVQELHLPVYHALCLAVENEMFKVGDTLWKR